MVWFYPCLRGEKWSINLFIANTMLCAGTRIMHHRCALHSLSFSLNNWQRRVEISTTRITGMLQKTQMTSRFIYFFHFFKPYSTKFDNEPSVFLFPFSRKISQDQLRVVCSTFKRGWFKNSLENAVWIVVECKMPMLCLQRTSPYPILRCWTVLVDHCLLSSVIRCAAN